MKLQRPPEAKLTLHVLAPMPEEARLVRRALAHAYPDAAVTTSPDPQAPEARAASIVIVDGEAMAEAKLDHFLESLPEQPAILVVPDLSQVRRVSRHLTGHAAVVTRADLGGMGLVAAVHHLLERQKLQEQLKKTAHRLKELSIRDELTHLTNHRHFDELLTSEVRKAGRYKRPLSLVILSIKNFTAINEAFGHEEGDRLLVAAADVIRGAVREVDIPARYGDNEFAVILPESDEAAAEIVAGRMRDALSALRLPGAGAQAKVAVSTGMAVLSETVETTEQLLKTALGALLAAKRNGGGAICTSNGATSQKRELRENRQLIAQLHERLAAIEGEAELGYFRQVLKAVGEIPLMKKHVLPHSERVAFYAQRLAERMGLPEQGARSLHRAGLLHDAGKLAIDPAILTKADRLSEPEEALMRQHPLFATQILGRSPLLDGELDAILHHHERYDGNGYPDALSGEKIPFAARVLAIAEAWDVMTSPQPYRPEPLSLDAALAELREGAGRQFDPELVNVFTELIAG